MTLSTRALRKACKHVVLVQPPRSKTFLICHECGERFPCKGCEHEDCADARTAGAIDDWPLWVKKGWL